MATPKPIRQLVIRKAIGLLQGVTHKALFNFDVGARNVNLKDLIAPNCEVPAICVIQRVESVKPISVQRHYERKLSFTVGFVYDLKTALDSFGVNVDEDPDQASGLFIADIQRALGSQHVLDDFVANLETPTEFNQHPEVIFREVGNAINVHEPITGRIYGQVDYEVIYYTSSTDPRYI